MERFVQDLRFAVRVLLKERGFTATALLTLAICIGANAAIFAIVNAVLLEPLPVPHPEQLVYMYNSYPGAGVGDRGSTGVPDYYDRLRETSVFQEQALYNTTGVTLGQEGNPQRVTAMAATPSMLRLLQVQPIRGRSFTDQEGELGNTKKVILTYGTWQQSFGGRDDAIGQSLRVSGEPYTIVGVLPRDFSFLDPDIRFWMPLAFTAEQKSDEARHSNNWSYLGRLKAGATIEQARQQIDALNARNLDRFPQLKQILINAGFHTVVVPLQAYLVRQLRGTLYLLWGGVAFVLLIGVVNIANLTLVRSTARMKELATRHALGAGLGRLARQLFTETVLLTLVGGGAGLLLGFAGVRALARYGLAETPQGTTVAIDARVMLFTFLLALLVGVAIGLVPVFGVRQTNLSQAFREEGRSGTASRGARVMRRVLVTVQVAFAFMLLIGAGLLLASFRQILAVNPGFHPDHVLTARVSPPATRYKDDPALRAFADRLLERVRALPGVEAAAITSNLPLGDDHSDSVILAEGYTMKPGESLISPFRTRVTPGYFAAMGIPVKVGRPFTASDTDKSPRVIIIDEKLAAKFFGTEDPVGRRMWQPDKPEELSKGPGPKSDFYTIVGVVGSVRMLGLTEKGDVGAYYFPNSQNTMRGMTLVVRSSVEPDSLASSIRRQVSSLDPELPLFAVQSMTARIDESLLNRRTPMLLAVLFAAIALFLASVGIYGVLAYQVSQRRREIGIRLALGSDGTRIFRLVVREGLVLLGAGVAGGLVGAFVIRRAVESQLYGITALDPRVLVSVAVVLGVVAFVACAVPARRAARIDPVIALTE
ncbi:MAG TPA: ABC transporter permease [Vicinamibacterales bacterium]|jgi:predicted permease|nr:ABC transporter permease [Vicinamibacterales bacterium]